MHIEDTVIRFSEAQERLGVSYSTLRRLIRKHDFQTALIPGSKEKCLKESDLILLEAERLGENQPSSPSETASVDVSMVLKSHQEEVMLYQNKLEEAKQEMHKLAIKNKEQENLMKVHLANLADAKERLKDTQEQAQREVQSLKEEHRASRKQYGETIDLLKQDKSEFKKSLEEKEEQLSETSQENTALKSKVKELELVSQNKTLWILFSIALLIATLVYGYFQA